jgi:hypothetical protein
MDDYVSGNWFAYFALLAWPVATIIFFLTMRFSEAVIWTVLGALLLLPAQIPIKFPMIPVLDKNSVASLGALLGYLLFARRGPTRLRFGLVELLAAIYVISPIITSLRNSDTLFLGNRILPGVGIYDGISAMLTQSIFFLTFFIGRRYLRALEENVVILRALTVAGLLMTLPMLFEIRMSPQLANWIYGYFPSSFSVEIRDGGFRPVVFMNNGLTAAFFLSTAVIATTAFWRVRARFMLLPAGGLVAYLVGVLLLCKSAGALVYAIVISTIARWLSPKLQLRAALLLAMIALLYPTLRMSGYFPTDALLSTASSFSPERAKSLKFRFDNEEKMLAHAEQRFLFGWGRYGRNRVLDEETGWESVTDGLWIITLGQFGFMGFIAQFGLFTLSVFRAASAAQFAESFQEKLLLSTLALIVAITAIEQLPNASITPWAWLLTGALLGRSESLRSRRQMKSPLNTPRDLEMVNHRIV